MVQASSTSDSLEDPHAASRVLLRLQCVYFRAAQELRIAPRVEEVVIIIIIIM